MKKILFIAFAVLASATLTAQAASEKKDKKTKKAQEEVVAEPVVETPVTLATQEDSVSYAAGLAQTRGLLEFLVNRMKVDTLYMKDFKESFMETLDRGTDPKFVAQMAGMNIAQQVRDQILPQTKSQFEGLNEDLFYKGFIAGAMNDTTLFSAESAAKYHEARLDEIKQKQNAETIAENTKWLEENAKKEGVVTLPSGLQYKVITKGEGAIATKDDNVTVKYEGKMIDGTVFDSSYTRTPDTTTFKPSQVIKGWTEALCMMPEGSKWELYIPQELAYGERQAGKIKPYSTLIFTVEIVKVEKQEAAAPATTTAKEAAKTPAKTVSKKK